MVGKFLAGRLDLPGRSGGTDAALIERTQSLLTEYRKEMDIFGFYKALNSVFELTALVNKYIDTEAPWKLAKEDPARLSTVLYNIWNGVRICTLLLYPFMPSKTASAWKALGINRDIEKAAFDEERVFYHADDLSPIERIAPLFPRREREPTAHVSRIDGS